MKKQKTTVPRIKSNALFLVLCCLVLLGSHRVLAQPDSADLTTAICGTDGSLMIYGAHSASGSLLPPPPSGSAPPSGTVATSFTTPGAIVNCAGGLVDLYFEDIQIHTGGGFDDPTPVSGSTLGATLGAIRVATFCRVVQDIQSTFDFALHVTGGHIRIHVAQSLDAYSGGTHIHAIPGDTWFARAVPQFTATPGLQRSWLNEYVVTGTDVPSPAQYHAYIQVNFDQLITSTGLITAIAWQNDYLSISNCRIDLYFALLHEIGHSMGFYSLVQAGSPVGGGIFTPGSVYGSSLPTYTTFASVITSVTGCFSQLDGAICGSNTLFPGAIPLVISGTGGFVINPFAPHANNNYWVNGLNAPDNYPMFSGGFSSGGFFSHTDDRQYSYSFRERISPGDRHDGIMGPSGVNGVYHRAFCKGEIQTFVNALGYSLTPAYIAAHLHILPNHLPYSQKMASLGINEMTYGNATEAAPADYTFTNNIGSSLDIDLFDPVFTVTDLSDGDIGDAITIDIPTIVNIRGCGVGGNNHNGLSMITPTHIRYTPRPNFYGIAQIGFNVTDGKERGAYRVVTIRVDRGTNVDPLFSGGNMVCNGDFEEGSEQVISGAETTPYGTRFDGGIHEGKWQGISFSDSHPFSFHSNVVGARSAAGIVVRNSMFNCTGTTITSQYGSGTLTLPYIVGGSAVQHPNTIVGGGNRYQAFDNRAVGSAYPPESYYYLNSDLTQCNYYRIEFDIHKPNDPYNTTFCTGCNADLTLDFADHIGAFNFSTAHVFPMTTGVWQHVAYDFFYCGVNPSNILHISNPLGRDFIIDNLQLTSRPAPAMAVAITDALALCTTHLTSIVTNAGCTPTTFTWTPSLGLSCTGCANPDASPLVTTTYHLTVTDACAVRNATADIVVNPTGPLPVTGPSEVCVASTITLAHTTGGGTWSSSSISIATVTAGGVVTGVAAGNATITYTISGCDVLHPITVNPLPLPYIVTGGGPACPGAHIGLSSSQVGVSYQLFNGTAPVGAALMGTGAALDFGLIVTVGTYTVWATYPLTGCTRLMSGSASITSTGSPLVYIVTGGGPYCAGGTGVHIYLSNSQTGVDYRLYNGSTLVTTVSGSGAMIDFGLLTAAGTYTVEAVIVSTGCTGMMSGSATITIDPLPDPISGPPAVCVGASITLIETTPGGAWTSSSSDATVVGGVVTGVTAGSATISYTMPGGCYVTYSVAVLLTPPAIVGLSDVCQGDAIILTDAMTGGDWTSSSTIIATVVLGSGVVTGVNPGIATITYTMPWGCAVTHDVHVWPIPAPITGSTDVCLIGGTTLLADATPGGVWSTTSSLVTISSTGLVTSTETFTGGATILYTIPATGCHVTYTVHVYTDIPHIYMVIGGGPYCLGGTVPHIGIVNSDVGYSYQLRLGGVPFGPIVLGVGGPIDFGPQPTPGTYTVLAFHTFTADCPGLMNYMAFINIVPGPTVYTLTALYGVDHYCIGGTGVQLQLSGSQTGVNYQVFAGSTAVTGLIPGTGSPMLFGPFLAGGPYTVIATRAVLPSCPVAMTGAITITADPLPDPIAGPDNLCIPGTITLTDGTPGGFWTSSNTMVATIDMYTGVMTGVSAGYTIITYHLLLTGCIITKRIDVYDGSICSPCAQFGIHPFTTISGTITADLGPGNYYVDGDITVTGTVAFNNAVMLMKSGIHIYVDPYAFLKINGSHLFAGRGCSDMWQGIVLNSLPATPGSTGKLELTGTFGVNSTLIEDAIIGVDIQSPQPPLTPGDNILLSNNTVFNMNNTGINIQNYTEPTPAMYPFGIANTVFTCRDLSFYPFGGGYPFGWASTDHLKYYWDPSTSDPVNGPYQLPCYIADPHADGSSAGYVPTVCHNGGLGTVGVQLISVGSNVSGYAGVRVGAPNTTTLTYIGGPDNIEKNLFENLAYGINCLNANLLSQNNLFANLRSYFYVGGYVTGNGINAGVNNGGKYQLDVEPGSYTGSYGGPPVTVTSPNYFYNCRMGVYAKDYFTVKGYKSYMISSQHALSGPSKYGYYISTPAYDNIDINENTITNLPNGIDITSTFVPSYFVDLGGWGYWTLPFQEDGNINVNSNTLKAALGVAPPTWQHMSFGIRVYNDNDDALYVPRAPGPTVTGIVNTNSNTINDVYHGIFVRGYWMQEAHSDANHVTVKNITPTSTVLCYGINHTDCKGNFIGGNVVSGADLTAYSMTVRGFYVQDNKNLNIGCNDVSDIGHEFEFYLNNRNTIWHHNRMHSGSNGVVEGMVLNGGIIDAQGDGTHPQSNVWLGPGTSTTWDLSQPQTDVIAPADPYYSPLYVVFPGGPAGHPIINTVTGATSPYTDYVSLLVSIPPVISDEYPFPCGIETVLPSGGRGAEEPKTTPGDLIEQVYTLQPNPTNGNFTLKQSIVDDQQVSLVVWDATGRTILKENRQFTDGTTSIQLTDIATGLYLLQVTDAKGKDYKFKFIVER